MAFGYPRRVFAALACVGAVAVVGSSGPSRLDATSGTCPDIDGDLLPGDVEWALLTDPTLPDTDADGIDDFCAAVGYVYPDPFADSAHGSEVDPAAPAPDHQARTVVTLRPDRDGTPAVWIHLLYRFVGGTIPPIAALDVWLNREQMSWSLGGLVGATGVDLAARQQGNETWLVFSARICREQDLVQFAPAVIGSTTVVDGRIIHSGVLLTAHAGKLVALTPTDPSTGVLVALDPAVAQDPFWSSDRVCWLTLSVLASTGNGHLCEITRAQCRRSPDLRCPPSCLTSVGQVVFVPDGLPLLTGN